MPEYIIRDAKGREVRRETTLADAIAPTTQAGETAEMVPEKPRKSAEATEAAPPKKSQR
jgi:hypothetical protein